MLSLDFRQLPLNSGGLSKLFIDYVYDFSKVKQFYTSDFHFLDNIGQDIEKARKSTELRLALVDALIEQNTAFGCSGKVIDNIRSLASDKTFCIVTGQQVGILGGPLYTLYKIFTALKLAEKLNTKFADYKFLPVFWLEGEDHDFEEANHITVLNQENIPSTIRYLIDGKTLDKNVGAVGEIVLDHAIDTFFHETEKTLPPSEFRPQLLAKAREHYISGRTFNYAFVSWINQVCSSINLSNGFASDLIFISSNSKRIKQLLSPIFLKELQEFPRTSQLVIDQSALLEKEYHTQIKPKAINLFLFHKGGRYLIEPREQEFSLKGTRHFPTRDELLNIATETPEMLSPNVVLRTICQDFLLPTVAYVAGPSEIAYFAQLKPVYDYFNVSMPTIFPRASATIVEQKLQTVLEKYQLGIIDFFDNREKLNDRIIDLLSEVNLDELFSNATKRIEEALGEMKFGLNYIDPTLIGTLDATRSKIESQIHVLEEKASAAQHRKHEVALKQVDKVINNIFPDGNFQERELNIIHFINKYGFDFSKWLYNELSIDSFTHQIIEL